MWLDWKYAVVIAAVIAMLTYVSRKTTRPFLMKARPFGIEASLIFGLYSIWQIAGQASVMKIDNATKRGQQIWDLERDWHFLSERTVQQWVLPHGWLVQFCNGYYAIMHVPSLVMFLVWLFVKHRDRYGSIRNTLAMLTGICLAIQLIPVAPPRFVSGLGVIDTPALYDQSVYGAVGTGVADQLSAMPSVHVGWAVLIATGTLLVSKGRWRWVAVVHALLTIFAVVATGNHFWLDGVVSVAIMFVIMGVQKVARLLWARWFAPDAERSAASVTAPASVNA